MASCAGAMAAQGQRADARTNGLMATTSPNDALDAARFCLRSIPPIFSDPAAEAEIGWVVDLVTAIRSVRAEMNITPATLTPLVLAGASAETKDRAERWSDVVKRMARSATSHLPLPPRKARCNSWCAARSRHCR